jgi:LysR family transcriptional regulator, glycine cleavage system transcriptional activator
MRHLPPLASIRVFEAAARHENFTQAAAELGMTQAAVSYQIRLLEQRLGLSLFARAKGRVALTDAGRRLAPLVTGAFDTLDEAFGTLAADDGSVLSISTAQTFATAWLAPRLGSFQVKQPELAVRMSTDNRLVDFSTGEFDLAIRIGRGGWQGLRHHFLFRSHVSPICSAAFQEAHRFERPEQLLRAPRLAAADLWWRDWLLEQGVVLPDAPPHPGIVLDNQVMEANAAFAGAGIAMMTPLFWRAELNAGRLIQPFAELHFPGTSYWLVYPEVKRSQPKVVAFRRWLEAEIAAAAPAEAAAVFVAPEDGTPAD